MVKNLAYVFTNDNFEDIGERFVEKPIKTLIESTLGGMVSLL